MYRIPTILLVIVSCSWLAAQSGLAQVSSPRDVARYKLLCDGVPCRTKPLHQPWWICDETTYSTPQDRKVTEAQQRRLEKFGLTIFSPALPGYGLQNSRFTRADLMKRFGQPLSTKSAERLPYDPSDPVEVVTTWEYRGLRLTTVASKPHPDVLWIDQGEVFDASVPLLYGVRIGQSIGQWTRQFGRPNCNVGVPPHSQPHWVYGGEYYFACGRDKKVSCVATYRIELYLDASGKVQRMKWSHPML